MMYQFTHKNVFITGGSEGLGLELAKAFIEAGSTVTICGRQKIKLDKALNELKKISSHIFAVPADVTNKMEVVQAIEKAVALMGSLDVVINNVGSTDKFGGFFDLDEKDWMDTYKKNVLSVVHTVKAAHPYLKKSKNPRVVNIASITGLQPGIFNPHYSASKAALINLSKHLSSLFAPDHILVNCIVPGTFESGAWTRNIERVAHEKKITVDEAATIENQLAVNSIPLNRIGQPKDIIPLILLLASEHAAWITGSCFVVDGGKMRSMH
ncbi:MAG: SDR family NAD(P)-dependent oxidoreductase [Candidatus Marinimicrobia bacterium]|nr:SDR family NAD(P)-dependent oxidoreductase [Candidatus Neomarinimicrobiota bacterium]